MRPQQVAQYQKAGRGFLVTRNSATLADTDYEHVAKEIVSALNDRARLVEALRAASLVPFPGSNNGERWDEGYKAGFNRALNDVHALAQSLLRELGEGE